MSEKLQIHLNNTYDDNYKLVSTAQIWDGNALISEWKTDDPRAVMYSGIEASEPNVFDQIKMKKFVEKAATLFEATSVTVEGK